VARKKKTPLEPDPDTVHARITPLECKSCFSHRAGILKDGRAQCADCGEIYDIKTFEPPDPQPLPVSVPDNIEPQQSAKSKELETKRRKTKADYRAEIDVAPPPELPAVRAAIDDIMGTGAVGIRKAQRLALNSARAYMDGLVDYWRQDTEFLRDLTESKDRQSRASALFARRWRPKFLAWLCVSCNMTISMRSARVDQCTVYAHIGKDREFAGQVERAKAIAIDLLEAQVWSRCVEGDLEPIHYMGVVVDYVRKFDSRLQIELLRAKRPGDFKTPGVNVNLGVRGDVFILTEEQRHVLMEINREWLETTPIPQIGGEQPQQLTNGDHGEANH
jgi:hypothetical protein